MKNLIKAKVRQDIQDRGEMIGTEEGKWISQSNLLAMETDDDRYRIWDDSTGEYIGIVDSIDLDFE
jgi:hypothetical protein